MTKYILKVKNLVMKDGSKNSDDIWFELTDEEFYILSKSYNPRPLVRKLFYLFPNIKEIYDVSVYKEVKFSSYSLEMTYVYWAKNEIKVSCRNCNWQEKSKDGFPACFHWRILSYIGNLDDSSCNGLFFEKKEK